MDLAEKLRVARNALKLTLEKVSERTGIGLSTLSEFENAKREPRLVQLKQLADIYRRPVGSFLDDEQQPMECVLWRQRPQSPSAEELQATLVDLAEKYRTLEALCDQNTSYDLPSVKTVRFTYPLAASLARRVRGELGLGDRPGQILPRVLEEICNIRVFHLDFEPTGSAACTLSERFGAAILLNSKNVRWRRNFDLAHELFHLLTWKMFGHHLGGQPTEPSEQEEKLATCFARNLLMPEEVFRESVDSQRGESGWLGFDGLFEVAREFDVSAEAVVWQLSFVYNIPTEKLRPTLSAVRDQASSWDVRESEAPLHRPVRFKALARQALRKGLLSTGKYADYMGVTRREAMKFVEQEASEDVQVEVAHP